ncbi:unnamed protein product [Triticum turgidum subsp. durum]|uniref:RIN4 pathogenic type III effector avirulence factor Avr cleavage site domain-containing protein n=1 Tax=Triticum turgidum subsp. durum TaxID=4567 RepID=A0A9R0ZZX4_TRITD|nr:unnamed protein product [Triticum turgidum subsp. durum]
MQKQQKNAHVPKFGNWDNDGNVPYTLYFDNARKGKGGKPINPNDPVENPEAFSSSVPTRGSAVPKFGDWDSNPASADGYTHIFNKVREEKSTQAKAPGFGKDNVAYGNGARQHDDGYVSSSRWCFGWCK